MRSLPVSMVVAVTLAQSPSGPNAEELIKKIDSTPDLQARQKPFEIAASLTRLYFGQGRVKEAQVYAKEALATAEPALTFFEQQKKKLGAQKPAAEAGGYGRHQIGKAFAGTGRSGESPGRHN